MIYRHQNKIEDAIIEYQQINQLMPNDLATYKDIISLSFQAQRYKNVIKYSNDFFKKKCHGIRHFVKSSYLDSIHWYLAYAYYFEEDYTNALNYFNKLLVSECNNEIYKSIGYCYLKIRNYDKAVSNYKLSLETVPNNLQVLFELATAYRENGDFQEALNIASKLSNLLPENPKVYFLWGFIYEGAKDYSLAKSYYKKVLEKDPNNDNAKQALEKLM